jgi:copper chaperone CopZ
MHAIARFSAAKFSAFFLLSACEAVLSGCGSELAGNGTNLSGGGVNVVVDVPEIHCESCAAKVTEVLGQHPGVQSVSVDVDTKQATVSIDQKVFDGKAAIALLEDYQFSGSKIVPDASR